MQTLLIVLTIGALALYAAAVILQWLYGAIESIVKKARDQTAARSKERLQLLENALDKARAATLPRASQSLLDLESKLKGRDTDRHHLETYKPIVGSPVPFPPLRFEPELPKLFRETYDPSNTSVDIDILTHLQRLNSEPPYELLKVISEEPPQRPTELEQILDAKVYPPPKWSEWACERTEYAISFQEVQAQQLPAEHNDKIIAEGRQLVAFLKQREAQAIQAAESRNRELGVLALAAERLFEAEKEKEAHLLAQRRQQYQAEVDQFLSAQNEERAELDRLVSSAKESSVAGLIARAEQTLRLMELPSFIPRDFSLKFDGDSEILILEHKFPDIGALDWYKLVELKNGPSRKPANQKETKASSQVLYPLLCLRFACELARLDTDNLTKVIVVNGWAEYTESTTGQRKRAYCSSLLAETNKLLEINLPDTDPMAAFSALKGVAARSLELTPIPPIMKLDTEDKRFVDAKAVIGELAEDENLAAMDWEDFEHLCRELFEKAFAESGAQVKVTQASRDQGVDAVIFDPDPLRGGKIVIQAKRYTNTVDVSAVRDLYGAIINEGAIKGILVTTSSFGPDSYSFAKDKPITLLDGSGLLGLLQQYGYSFRINLEEAKKVTSHFGRASTN